MGAVTLRGPTYASTNNATSYVVPTFVPVAGELMIVTVQATDTVANNAAVTVSANGLTFTRAPVAVRKNGSVDTQWFFVANQLVPASPVTMTLTASMTADAGTGAVISAMGVAGMTRVGLSAIRQIAIDENEAGGVAPVTTFTVRPLTTSTIVHAMHHTTASGSKTPPTGFTKIVDLSYSTPVGAGLVSYIPSGFTSFGITAGNTGNGPCSALSVELDTTAPDTPYSGWGIAI